MADDDDWDIDRLTSPVARGEAALRAALVVHDDDDDLHTPLNRETPKPSTTSARPPSQQKDARGGAAHRPPLVIDDDDDDAYEPQRRPSPLVSAPTPARQSPQQKGEGEKASSAAGPSRSPMPGTERRRMRTEELESSDEEKWDLTDVVKPGGRRESQRQPASGPADPHEAVAEALRQAEAKHARAVKSALAAQARQAAMLHKAKLEAALKAQHAELHSRMLDGTLPPPSPAHSPQSPAASSWSAYVGSAAMDLMPSSAKSVVETWNSLFGVESSTEQLTRIAREGTGAGAGGGALGPEISAALAAASDGWKVQRVGLEERLREAEERCKKAEERAEGLTLQLIEARHQARSAKNSRSVARPSDKLSAGTTGGGAAAGSNEADGGGAATRRAREAGREGGQPDETERDELSGRERSYEERERKALIREGPTAATGTAASQAAIERQSPAPLSAVDDELGATHVEDEAASQVTSEEYSPRGADDRSRCMHSMARNTPTAPPSPPSPSILHAHSHPVSTPPACSTCRGRSSLAALLADMETTTSMVGRHLGNLDRLRSEDAEDAAEPAE